MVLGRYLRAGTRTLRARAQSSLSAGTSAQAHARREPPEPPNSESLQWMVAVQSCPVPDMSCVVCKAWLNARRPDGEDRVYAWQKPRTMILSTQSCP